MISANKAAVALLVAGWLALLSLAWILTGCTVTPKPSPARPLAHYVENNLDSGIVKALYLDPKAHTGFQGFLVTQGWVDQYNSLAGQYGYLLTPRVKPGDGITPVLPEVLAAYGLKYGFNASAQAMVAWRDMKAMPGLGREKEGVVSKVVNALK